MLLAYTDENHGYGNVGTDDPPAQSPLDSQPEPGSDDPNLDDAAFTAAAGDSHFSDSGEGHVDNYSDPSRDDERWRFDFDCLTFDVGRMAGQDVAEARNLVADVAFETRRGLRPVRLRDELRRRRERRPDRARPGAALEREDGRDRPLRRVGLLRRPRRARAARLRVGLRRRRHRGRHGP